jgi:alpha-tubulin suppressor-like RCC1 family protein
MSGIALRKCLSLAMSCALLALSACGGGGDSSPKAEPTSVITPTPPVITAGPASASVTEGQSQTFSVQATSQSVSLTYQWRLNGADIAGATNASLTTAATKATDDGAKYLVAVSNTAGTTVSPEAVLTVKSPPRISTAPQAQTLFTGQTATFNVSATGTAPLTYAWLRNGTAISGATEANYTTPALTLGDSGSNYSVQVTNAVGNVTSVSALLTVNPAPSLPNITTPPQDTTVLAGRTASFSVVAAGSGPLSYQWLKDGAPITGATAASYTTPTLVWTDTLATYSVVVTNNVGKVTSKSATLMVTPRVVQISAGASMASARKEDGSVWSWGYPGLQGDGVGANGNNSTSIYGKILRAVNTNGTAFNNVSTVVNGYSHTLAIKADGSLWSWGDNSNGELGNGKSASGFPPQLNPGAVLNANGTPFSDVASVSGGFHYTLAVKTDGSAWAWGRSVSGVLGNNSTTQANVLNPTQVLTSATTPLTGVRQLAANDDHAAALKTDGTVWVWGSGQAGRLGDGNGNSFSTVAIPLKDSLGRLIRGVQQVSVGNSHTMLLMNDGTVFGFGDNAWGHIGTGANKETRWATLVIDRNGNPFGKVVSVQAGRDATAFLRADGTVWMAGRNTKSQLAQSLTVDTVNVPTQVLMADGTPLDNVIQISLEYETVIVLRGDGTVWGWGSTTSGQLGIPPTNQVQSYAVPQKILVSGD